MPVLLLDRLLAGDLFVGGWPEVIPGGPDATDAELDDEDHGEAADHSGEEGVDDVLGKLDLIDGGEDADDPDSGDGDTSDGVTSGNLGEAGAEHSTNSIGNQASNDDDGNGDDDLGDEADQIVQRVADGVVAEGAERELQHQKHDEVVEELGDKGTAVSESCPLEVAADSGLVDVGVKIDLAKKRGDDPSDPFSDEAANHQYDQEQNELRYEADQVIDSAGECSIKVNIYSEHVH